MYQGCLYLYFVSGRRRWLASVVGHAGTAADSTRVSFCSSSIPHGADHPEEEIMEGNHSMYHKKTDQDHVRMNVWGLGLRRYPRDLGCHKVAPMMDRVDGHSDHF